MTDLLVIAVFSSIIGVISSTYSLLIGFTLLTILVSYLYFIKQSKPFYILLTFSILIIFYFIGIMNENFRTTSYVGDEQKFLVEVTKPLYNDGAMLRGEVYDLYTNEKLMLMTNFKSSLQKTQFQDEFSYPQVCKLTGKLERPGRARNENAFNYEQYLYRENIHWLVKVEQLDLTKCISKKADFLTKVRNLREKGVFFIKKYFPEKSAPLVSALIFGERELMDQSELENYQKLGIAHLLAISGLHVGLVSGMLYFGAIRIGIRKEIASKFMLIILPIYALLTGAAPSVVRAVIMIWLVIATQILKVIKMKPVNSICIAFLLLVFYNPYYIFHVGFQLSFVVSFCLIMSASTILPRYKSRLGQLFLISLIAQIASLPILAYHFYEVSIISTLMNMFYVPLFSVVILPLSIIVFVIHLIFPSIASPITIILTKIITAANKFAELCAKLPFATLVIGRPNNLFLTGFIIAICIFFYKLEKRTQLIHHLRSFLLLVILIVLQWFGAQFSPFGEVTFIDVGQGDSIFIKLPFNQGNYLIDAGGVIHYEVEQWEARQRKFDPGRQIVEPLLKSKGITTIDKLIVSHGHLDHMGGAFHLINSLNVKEVVFPKVKELTDAEKQFLQLVSENNIRISIVTKGAEWTSGNTKFVVISPAEDTYRLFDQNDGSIVILSNIGGLKWLFTGDLEEKGELFLVKNYPRLNVDVLKVGHHGSNTSTTEVLLNSIKPRYAIISAGVNNRFGHPHNDVISRLKERNIQIYRTDENGSITYKFLSGRQGTFHKLIP